VFKTSELIDLGDVPPGWKLLQVRAQEKKTYPIDGADVPRIAWGSEPFDPELPVNNPDTGKRWDEEDCWDCSVAPGQLHVYMLCECERCPICHHQWISCEHYWPYSEQLAAQFKDRPLLAIGMRVRATDDALQQGIVMPSHEIGVVVGFGKRKGVANHPDMPRVLSDGQARPLTYNRDWWEPIS